MGDVCTILQIDRRVWKNALAAVSSSSSWSHPLFHKCLGCLKIFTKHIHDIVVITLDFDIKFPQKERNEPM